jgi:PAS domain S-box-containing protein
VIQSFFRDNPADLMDLLPAGVYCVDADGVLQWHNRRAAELWGRSPEMGNPATRYCGSVRMYNPDGTALAHDQSPLAESLRDGRPRLGTEVTFERPDGSRVNVLVNARPVRDGEGKLVGAMTCIQDVTDYVRAEEQLRFQLELSGTLFDAAADSIFLMDADGRTTYANRAAEETFGFAHRELLGQRLHDLIHHVRPDGRALPIEECALGRVFVEQKALRDHEDVFVRKDGQFVPVACSNAPVFRHGRMVGAVLIVHDISEHRRVEQELMRAKEEAEAANRAKDGFLAALSHELRTPLTPVLMAAAALEGYPALPDDVRDDLTMIRRNVELEARLIDDLLDLTRISRGKLQIHPEAVNAHALLLEAVRTCCGPDTNQKRQVVRMELRAGASTVWGDGARLQQIFWNLLKNAVKFTPDRGTITVRTDNVKTPSGQDQIVIEVTDTGIGIDPAALDSIFNAFEQGSGLVTRRFGGLGLGLAITKALVELHGGTIRAASGGPEQGATFTVAFNTTASPADSAAPAASAPDARRGLRILLVEDHETTAKVLSRLLRNFDHDVHTAGTVRSALDAVREKPFDLLISDLGLPDGTGFELMQEIRERYPLRGIALSGYGMEQDVRRSRDVGFSMHLTKPIDFRKLQVAIAQVAP